MQTATLFADCHCHCQRGGLAVAAGIADDSGTGMTKVVCHCNIYDKFVILLHSDNDSNEKLESDSMTDLWPCHNVTVWQWLPYCFLEMTVKDCVTVIVICHTLRIGPVHYAPLLSHWYRYCSGLNPRNHESITWTRTSTSVISQQTGATSNICGLRQAITSWHK